jgi:putative heme-binding domain-containing protein
MRFVSSLAAVFVLGSPVFAQPKPPNLPPNLLAPTDPLSPADERKAFTLPPGFDVQLVASEPDIQKPMQLAFDAKGRMWVTTSYHYPFASEGKPTDKLFVLSDFDPQTGKARKVQKFAEDLNIPIGILPLPDCKSCIVSSTGEIRKYTDTNDDGKADKMEVLFQGFGVRDTHGMYNSYTLMPDGWVYACHGFNNDSTVKGKDGHEVKMQSGHTFRFKPDGSRIEVWTRGQVNPFGMAVDPWFNLYTADCHSKPITQLIPGAYYDSFGKPHDGLGFAPHVTSHPHKSTGLCGLTWYDADHFPKEYLGCMFLGDVVSNCISLDRIEWRGASPVAKELPDFLTSKDRWFRPVDIKLGPDGALYVADFYNKIIGHYEVDLRDPRRDKDRGRIWRIVWTGKDGKGPPPKFHRADFTTAKSQELVEDAGSNPNATVRALATQQLLMRLQAEEKISALKAAEVFLTLTADATGVRSVPEDSAAFRNQMLRARIAAAGATWTAEERKEAVARIADTNAKLKRAWVDAVIAHPHKDFVEPLIEVLKKCAPDDTHLRQAAKIALRNCLRDADAWPPYKDDKAREKGFDPIYAEIALAVPNKRAAEYLLTQLAPSKLPAARLVAMAEHIARYGDEQEWLSALLNLIEADYKAPIGDAILGIFRAIQARGKSLEGKAVDWVLEAAEKQLRQKDPDAPLGAENVQRLNSVFRVLNALPAVAKEWEKLRLPPKLASGLEEWVRRPNAPVELQVGAADALLHVAPAQSYPTLSKLLDDPKLSPAFHERLLIVFAGSNNGHARLDARDALKNVPYRVAVPIGLALASTKGGAEDLLIAVKEGKAPQRLLQEKAILERLRGSNAEDWQKRVADLTKNLPPADQRLADLIKKRSAAFASAKIDKAEGAKLFTKHCAACHRIGDMGGKIAPQLDGIGVRGVERLLEDILDPNRNVDQAFRARSITLTNEKTLTALMLRVEGEVLVVADLEGKEQRIPLKEIAVNRETMLSAMPANFADVVPEAELHQIVAYLLDQKAKDPPKKE